MIGGCAARAHADSSRPPQSDPGTPAPAVTAATPAATDSAKLDAARVAVLAAYRAYIHYSTLSAQDADFDSPQLRKYAIDPLLGQWVVSVNAMFQQGLVQRGSVVDPDPSVADVRLFTKSGVAQGTATIVDCLDNTGITFIDAIKRSVVGNEVAHPFLSSVASAEMFPDGHWVIARVDTKDVRSC